jgi:uncharacterized protein YndB with AHSA1/START domain
MSSDPGRSRVLVALRVPAPPQRAFRAFTEEIGRWWQPNGLFEFRPGQPGTLRFEGDGEGRYLVEHGEDGERFEVGRVTVWEPPHRLALSWREASFAADQQTEVHVRFDDVGAEGRAETRVTVEHFGWDTIPRAHAARHGMELGVFQRRLAEWWQQLLRSVATSVGPR